MQDLESAFEQLFEANGKGSEFDYHSVTKTKAEKSRKWIVLDVESLVVISREGPEAIGSRWQRMARMAGQHGAYFQTVPSKEDWSANLLKDDDDDDESAADTDESESKTEADEEPDLAG